MEMSYLQTANRLYQYLYDNHWDGERLLGPDCGVRWNRRVFRYGKSLLSFIDWQDDYYYLQAQAYWILSNLSFAEISSDYDYVAVAKQCAAAALEAQKPDGHWDYPDPEWQGRIHTVDCTWASIGMLAVYQEVPTQESLLEGALSWYNYLVNVTQFQEYKNTLAINYFSNFGSSIVPNNTPVVLAFLGRLAAATNNQDYLEYAEKLIAFMKLVQKQDGEIPYKIKNEQGGGADRIHFQCYQYNAFQLQHLATYYTFTDDTSVFPIIEGIAKFIATGVRADGSCQFDCQNTPDHAYYHTMVVASSLAIARRLGLYEAKELEDRAANYVASLQRKDGSMPYSKDYVFVPDNRSYPRTLSMTMYHLLNKHTSVNGTPQKEQALK